MDNQENREQIFLCLQTMIKDCDYLVTLFILYQKSNKRTLFLIQSSIRQEEVEQTADHFSEQTRSCTAEGEPGEEDCSNEAGGYCPAGGAHWKGVLESQKI